MTPRLSALFENVYRELRPVAPMPGFEIRFFCFANLNNTIRLAFPGGFSSASQTCWKARRSRSCMRSFISDCKAVSQGNRPGPGGRYRRFTGSHDMTVKTRLIRQIRGRKRIESPRGHHYDLEQVFDELNSRFFHGLMGAHR